MTDTGIDAQEIKLVENRSNLANDTKYTEMKTLDNCFLQKYDVKMYGSDKDNYDIINDFLQENQSEEAFYIIDLGEIVKSYNNWIRLLPDVKPFYAVKCNSNPVILEALSELERKVFLITIPADPPARRIFMKCCKKRYAVSPVLNGKFCCTSTRSFPPKGGLASTISKRSFS